MIKGVVVAHKMGPTVLRHLQQTQYLDYWRSRTGAGAWFKHTDIDGHAAACKRARKWNPKRMPCSQYRGVNGRQPTFDIIHMRNHRYNPTAFEWEQAWTCEVIGAWLVSGEDETATAVGAALSDAGVSYAGEVIRGDHLFGVETIREKTLECSPTDIPKTTSRRQSENEGGNMTSR